MDNYELYHYGVKGMKWGRGKSSTSSSTKKKGKSNTNDKQDKIKLMSDDELRKAINRMQLEQQYSKLSPSTVSSGKKYAQKIMKTGATIATVTSTGLTVYNNVDKINKIINKAK